MSEIRLTTPSHLVLGIIDKLGEAGPYDVKVEAARTVAPFWSVPHAQVYAQCDRLLEAGLLSEVRQPGGRNRRLMSLTGAGVSGRWLLNRAVPRSEGRNPVAAGAGGRQDAEMTDSTQPTDAPTPNAPAADTPVAALPPVDALIVVDVQKAFVTGDGPCPGRNGSSTARRT